jgi:hypothetical protein
VLSQMALTFFPDRAAAVQEMTRFTTPGGTVALLVPGAHEHQQAFARFADLAARHVGDEARSLLSTYFLCGNLDQLASLAESSRLQVTTARTEVGTYRAPSVDAFVTTEVESTPLVQRISPDVYARIRNRRPPRPRAVHHHRRPSRGPIREQPRRRAPQLSRMQETRACGRGDSSASTLWMHTSTLTVNDPVQASKRSFVGCWTPCPSPDGRGERCCAGAAARRRGVEHSRGAVCEECPSGRRAASTGPGRATAAPGRRRPRRRELKN